MSSGYSMGGCPAVSAWPGATTAVCGAAVGRATAQRCSAATAALVTAPRRQQRSSATARSGASKRVTSSEASPAREAAGAEEARLKAGREHAERAHSRSQQRVRASGDQASAPPRRRIRSDYGRLRQRRTPTVSQQQGPRQEIRARGKRLRSDYDRPRPITHRLQPITER
jgi:hypothetical protein